MYKYHNGNFYPFSLKEDYVKSGSWPEHGVDVDSDTAHEFMQNPPEGKVLGGGKDGMPEWVNKSIKPKTIDELILEINRTISIIRDEVDYTITPLQDALDLEIATNEEISHLHILKKYRAELHRIKKQKGYPEKIVWPKEPECLK